MADAAGGGSENLVFPENLLNEERAEVANILQTCHDSFRQPILDEIEGNIRGKTLRRGAVPLCRALVLAAQTGTFTASVGVAVLARRQADARYSARLAQTPTPIAEETALSAAAIEEGAALLERIRTARKLRESCHMEAEANLRCQHE